MQIFQKLFPPKKLKIQVHHLRETLSWQERTTRGVDPNPKYWGGKVVVQRDRQRAF